MQNDLDLKHTVISVHVSYSENVTPQSYIVHADHNGSLNLVVVFIPVKQTSKNENREDLESVTNHSSQISVLIVIVVQNENERSQGHVDHKNDRFIKVSSTKALGKLR